MEFNEARYVEEVCTRMRQSDYPRGVNRAAIDLLANGAPPVPLEQASEEGVEINFNDLSLTRSAHDARAQLANAFMKPGNYFKCSTDMGPLHRRADFSAIVTREINRIMKRSLPYFECCRSKFALDILHGIGPAAWPNPDKWCPRALGIDDVLIPGGTELTMDEMPFYALRQSWTAPKLIRMIRGLHVDKGWNVPLAESCLKWLDDQTAAMQGGTYGDMWSPEKLEERLKSDGACYSTDQTPRIHVFDFHFWHDDGKVAGWRRRIIFDASSAPARRPSSRCR